MTRGIYFLANDRSLDHALALVNSIRRWDTETPLVMIPHRAPFEYAARVLTQRRGITLYADTVRVERLMRNVRRIFGANFFPRPDNLKKQLCWFGPFDEFLYLDADIIVFERIIQLVDALRDHDFLCYSDQHEGGIAHVFKPSILQANIFSADPVPDIFNAGFWGGRRGVWSEEQFYAHLEECARNKIHLDRSRGGSDQPVFNYLVLKHLPRRINLYRTHGAPRMWAGTNGFERRGEVLIDPRVNAPLKFLHWAGIQIAPGAPYWDVWAHYRFLDRTGNIPFDLARGKMPPRTSRLNAFWERNRDCVWNRLDQWRLHL